MSLNAYYSKSFAEFLTEDTHEILKQLVYAGGKDPLQENAWKAEILLLKEILSQWNDETAQVLFEYTIPRLAKRIDVVLLLRNIVFCLEFKVGETQYLQNDEEQVMDYALDLKNFHKESQNRIIVPILIATEATEVSHYLKFSVYNDKVYKPLFVNSSNLSLIINKVLERNCPNPTHFDFVDKWEKSRYEPTPTIIEAATALYLNHSVEDITRTEASGETLKKTTDFILDVIERSRSKKEKSICFVTGVPGAGKTLVGLNVAIEQSKRSSGEKHDSLAVYLSGNGPLVKVLTSALARDKRERDGGNYSDALREVKQFIQEIYNYREQMLNKIKTPIVDGKLEIDEKISIADENAGHSEIEHIAIFDEAQRSWNLKKLADWLAKGGSYGNKRKVPDFPMSEAEFLIWSLNLRKDWAVIVCLVGGGQEIHNGEAGIGEWVRAVKESFPNWNVYISDHLTDKEYAEGNVKNILSGCQNIHYSSDLHLAVSMRSFRAEKLSLFVHHLLERNVPEAKKVYEEIKANYPICLTRNIDVAKDWLRKRARGSERYGIIVSSKAERLRPLAIDVKRECDVVHWFLDDERDLRSSLFLEDVATEFDVQGLELDWACVAWDGDLRYKECGWDYYTFRNNRWQKNRQEINQKYQINAYRVLLTRARQGMVLCVPEGNREDPTRQPEFYDNTYKYLESIGLQVIPLSKNL